MRPRPRIERSVPLGRRKPRTPIRAKHLGFVKQLPCIACGAAGPCEAAHVRMSVAEHGKFNAMARKPDGKYTVPLCGRCHRGDQHTKYGEPEFWSRLGIDPVDTALRLWTVSGDLEAGQRLIFRARQAIALHKGALSRG